jgi:hypothetical protein
MFLYYQYSTKKFFVQEVGSVFYMLQNGMR